MRWQDINAVSTLILGSTGRVTTWEVWKLIGELKVIVHRQTTLIESTKAEL